MAIDFTRYQPPGVYTESLGGPQLAVRSSVPTAVAIFGLTQGYRTYRESVKINPDALDAEGDPIPAVNATLAKRGIKVITSTPRLLAATNVNIASPGAEIDDVVLSVNDLVYLVSQTKAAENGLYKFKGATTPLEVVVDTFKVVNPTSGTSYVNGKDYTIHRVTAGDDATAATRDDLYTIKRVISEDSTLEEGDIVQVSYRYTDPEYFEVYSLYDYDDVRDIYGEPFDASGNIQSELTLAAKFAFTNGASTVLTCAVDPADPANPVLADYKNALDKFRDEEQIAIIVPATGQQQIQPLVQDHVRFQSNNKYERRAIIGMDGATTAVSTNVRIENAQALSDQRIALISPSRFTYFAPELNRNVVLGGQFMAAAVAGKSVSQIAAMPLTRKIISGFIGPAAEPGPTGNSMQREGEKNLESQNGLMVVEKTRRNQVQVRHGVTTNSSDLLTREWSIIGQQDVMVYRIRDYLDADGLIGMPIYDTTLIQVKASAEAALVSLVRDQVIVGYKNLKVRQLATLPDVIEVRYEWKPAYPLNYIVVRYSVEVMSGDVTITEGTTTTTPATTAGNA